MKHTLKNPQDILDSRYDFPMFDDEPIRYAVATTQRSGSTKFCLDLWATGSLGGPWEYFNLPFMVPLFRRFATRTLADYAAALVRHRTTPNGVFGHKIFMATYAIADFEAQQLADRVLPDRLIFLRRRDKIGQARSMARAMATQHWVATDGATAPEPGVDAQRAALRYICWQEALWERRFDDRGVEPLRVWFEDHLADPHTSIARIFDFVGTDDWNARVPMPDLAVQSSAKQHRQPPAFDVAAALREPFSRDELRLFMREMNPAG